MRRWNETDALQKKVMDRIPPDLRKDAVPSIAALSQSMALVPHLTHPLTKSGDGVNVALTACPLLDVVGLVDQGHRAIERGE
jgi:hypothetical protein